MKFLVEVLAEVTDGSVHFWLESADLQDAYERETEKKTHEQVANIAEAGVLTVEVP